MSEKIFLIRFFLQKLVYKGYLSEDIAKRVITRFANEGDSHRKAA